MTDPDPDTIDASTDDYLPPLEDSSWLWMDAHEMRFPR